MSTKTFLFMTTELGFGGGERIFEDLVRAASRLGHAVDVMVPPKSVLASRLWDYVNVVDSEYLNKYDITVANDFDSLLFLTLKRHHPQYICHGPWQMTFKMAVLVNTLNIKVWCVSTYVLGMISRKWSVRTGLLRVLPYAPELSPIPNPEPPTAMKPMIWEDEDFVICTVARYHSSKKLELLISAAASAKVKLVLGLRTGFNSVDELTSQKAIQALAAKEDVFVVSNKEPQVTLSMSDLFVSVSPTETLGIATMEAMKFGVPVLTFSCGGTQDFAVNNFNCRWISGHSEEEVVDAIQHLQHSPKLLKHLSSNALNAFEGKNPDNCVWGFIENEK